MHILQWAALIAIAGLAFYMKETMAHTMHARKPRTKQAENTKPPYARKDALLNSTEQKLFHTLKTALPDQHVLAQVRLADIIEVDAPQHRKQQWLNGIISKSVDFVICDGKFNVLACVELDGPTHQQSHRQNADNDKDTALKAAGIKIIRWEPHDLPTKDEIRTEVLSHDTKGD
jgi:hypothetical protein